MAFKEYALNTIYGITTVELNSAEHEALSAKAKLKEDQRAIFANAAMILELLDEEEPQASASIAELAGIDPEKSASWRRALAALNKAGLIQQHGHGSKARFTKVSRAEAPVEDEALPEPQPWTLAPVQTLVYGMTGSGKSNALQGIIRQLAPFVKDGTAKLYGIDPKASELRPYADSHLFEELSIGYGDDALDEHIAVIHTVGNLLANRAKSADSARSFTPSTEQPLAVLVIEELDSLLRGLRGYFGPGEQALRGLERILATGRALGVYIVAASQTVSIADFRNLRDNFGRIDVLAQTSPYLNEWILGAGAAEAGFDSTAIETPMYANGYRTAGVGFSRDHQTGEIRKVRFPYVSDEEIAALVQNFQKDADGEEAE